MHNSNNKRIAKNAIFLYIRMLVLMIVSLYTTRVLLKVLGIDDYGIFNVVGGLIVMIIFITQGLTGAARRYIMAEITTGNLRSQRIMYTNVVYAHILLSAFILIIGETIGLWFLSNYLNIPEGRFSAAMWVYQLSLLSSIVTIMLSPFNASIISEEKMSAYAYFSIIDAILKLLIVWLLMAISGDKLIMYAFFLVCVSVTNFMMYRYYCHLKFPMCRIVKIDGTKQLKDLFGYMGWTVFGVGANVASRQGVTMLVNVFFNVAVNAAIGISNMIIKAASQFVHNFQMAFSPQLTKNYIAGNYKELNSLVNRSSRYSSFLVLIMLIPISIVITDLLKVWLGDYPKYTEEFCILTLICIYFEAMSNPLITVITADKKIKLYQLIISLLHLLNFCVCWCVLILGFLPYYVIVVRLLFSIVGLIIRLMMIKNKVPGFSVALWVKSIVVKGCLTVMLCIPFFLLNSNVQLFDSNLWARFFATGIISFLWTALVLWLIGLNSRERIFIREKVVNIIFKS